MIRRTSPTSRRKFPGPTTLILVSLLLGVGCGLFLGEYCGVLRWAGEAYVGLLQMAVLPYITVSLVANTGRLSLSKAGRLIQAALLVLVTLWSVGLLTVLALGRAFPNWETGSFFSTSYIEPPESLNFVGLFIPANPFFALANNIIPAVVVFSLGLGAALIGVPNKEPLLESLTLLAQALSRLNRFVVRLAPVGVFAIVAHAVGTVPVEQFGLLQAYLITVTAGGLILVLGVVPALIALTTPIGYRESLQVSRDALITAFVLGNTFAVIPLIIEASREVLRRHGVAAENGSAPDALVPLAFPFPDLGRIVRLVFIPFASWFYGHSLELAEYTKLLTLGMIGCFAKLTITIPWLLGQLHIPSDIFQLYLLAEVYTTRLGDLLKASHLFAFAVIVSCALNGSLRIRWRRLLVVLPVLLITLVLVMTGVRSTLSRKFQVGHERDDLVRVREMLLPSVDARVVAGNRSATDLVVGETVLQRIERNGKIRVGFDPYELPFSYFNDSGDLVGFDIEMAHQLARDLGVSIEFTRFQTQQLATQMRDDEFDIVMAGLEGTHDRASELMLTESYLDVTLGIVVPDYRRREFQRMDAIRDRSDLTFAVVRDGFYAYEARRNLEHSTIVEIGTEREFFERRGSEFDALITSAETGSAWTLLYPEYSVVNPVDRPIRVPLYYVIAPDNQFRKFLEVWLTLKQRDGTIQRLYDYWVLGQSGEVREPRWCIIRDVLGWVE